ncbi:MAG TPA: type III pantothenate kinase [Prolixibacteraceae bacterium]|nr:type III pantothenate kinase [Prolixibacteraceae bacterium]
MINLVIDIGNSRSKLALFNQQDLMFNVPVDHLTVDHLKMLKDEHVQMKRAILSSTKLVDQQLLEYLNKDFTQFIELDHLTPLPIANLYETPETLGKDRIAAAVGANELFPNQNVLVIDAGTAITYDFVSAENQYLGGNISPGLQMRFKALNQFTDKLPLVDSSAYFSEIGKNTKEAIRGGVQNGILFEIEKTIEIFAEKYEDLQVILTGGDSAFLSQMLNADVLVHLNLTLIGLNRILEFNSTKK